MLTNLDLGARVRSTSGAFAGVAIVVSIRPGTPRPLAIVETVDGDLLRVGVDDLEPSVDLVEGLLSDALDPPDRWLIRLQAIELLSEQQRTGMASGLRVVPLPHQVLAAHHAIDGTDGRVLLADDVGMGKTIEVGLLLAVLRARDQAKRVLILCPAGLRQQWQEELHGLFGLYFDVLGDQVSPGARGLWDRYDRVIASMELLRSERHREAVLAAPHWDVLVVDEAHRVAARGRGSADFGPRSASRIERTQLYHLVEGLAPRAQRVFFATATPHQGRDDQFVHLVRLLRPDALSERDATDPDVFDRLRPLLSQVVVRTPKSMAIDWAGQRVFQGSLARTVQVPVLDEDEAFSEELLDYIERGFDAYDAALAASRSSAVLINFVMTTFLKLWTSSRPAIRSALVRRRDRIREARARSRAASHGTKAQLAGLDSALDAEQEEAVLEQLRDPGFFDDELELIDALVASLDTLGPDPKIAMLVAEMARLRRESTSGVLVFTEYVETQKAICDALIEQFGADEVVFIRGGRGAQNLEAAARFQSGTPFLVSTQAGGEGLNLQYGGHVLVNFDQPWNPLRTLQRIGRLDRFGQAQRVTVVNLVRTAAIDERILSKTWAKLQRATEVVTRGSGDHGEDLLETVVGEFVNELDLPALVRNAIRQRDSGDADRAIDQALERVQRAAATAGRMLDGLDAFRLGEASRFEPFSLGPRIDAFVHAVLAAHQRRLTRNDDGTSRFRLPDVWRGGAGLYPKYPAVVFDAAAARTSPGALVLGFGVPVFDRMLDWARFEASPLGVARFRSGGAAGTAGLIAVFAGLIHSQGDGGLLQSQTRHVVVKVNQAGEIVDDMTFQPLPGDVEAPTVDEVRALLARARQHAAEKLDSWRTHAASGSRRVGELKLEGCAWYCA